MTKQNNRKLHFSQKLDRFDGKFTARFKRLNDKERVFLHINVQGSSLVRKTDGHTAIFAFDETNKNAV